MKGQGSKIRGLIVRGARINNPIQRGIGSGGMDGSVSMRCSKGQARCTGRSGRKRAECRGG